MATIDSHVRDAYDSAPDSATFTAALVSMGFSITKETGNRTVLLDQEGHKYVVFDDGGKPVHHLNNAANTVFGSNDSETIRTGGGADTVDGGQGDDKLYGGSGGDFVDGGAGDDTLRGGTGADDIYGGDGNDTLFGGTGDDSLYGGDGNDTLKGGAGNDMLSGGAGDDLLSGGRGNDVLVGGAGDDILTGGKGTDIFEFGTVPGSTVGNDSITDFSADDSLKTTDGLFVQSIAAGPNGAIITFSDGGTVVLNGVTVEQLTQLDSDGDGKIDTIDHV